MVQLTLDPHPLLDAAAFTTRFGAPLGEASSPDSLLALFKPGSTAPLASSDEVRGRVRDLLRHGGFKPTGRSKPASEYLIRASEEGALGSINLAVDACNAVSLHSGLPISVIDLDLAEPPYQVKIVPDKVSYIFNPSGQELDLQGLVCFWDKQGPCGSPVKDSQRTKTHPETRRILVLIWGCQELPQRVEAAAQLYRELLQDCGASLAK
ncbi:MAG TPA: phenylalanine--tRNA ligase beta subunit-related protein [Myxococcota bacterium]|nr:phenylalanine--tRNA ligase beta subunit-related protein [Myxococcota bacterium]